LGRIQLPNGVNAFQLARAVLGASSASSCGTVDSPGGELDFHRRSTTGGTNISVNGANFASDATVTVGGVVATSVVFRVLRY
jgi:hypothetical protein